MWEKLGDLYCITVYCSKYMVVWQIKTVEATAICKKFEDILCMIGVPHTFMGDNAVQFRGEMFMRFIR